MSADPDHLLSQVSLNRWMRRTGSMSACLAAALLWGCGVASDEVVTESDRTFGAEQHEQLLAEFGGSYEGDEAAYVKRIGNALAAEAGLDGECTFTLVNSQVVNAFAVPGCYIYVTRGLMGIVNSEAELGAVLSHEIGHIVGRHAQRQQRRSLWRSLGVAAVQLVTGSERLTRVAGAAAGLFTLRYSRKQEYEADDLGLSFLKQAGYDPFAAVDMLQALGRHEQFVSRTGGRDEGRSIPEWARTHPLTGNRVARTGDAAAGTGLTRGALPEKETAYLQAVDGLLYGDAPEQGFVLGRTFAHPRMRIAFRAPEGFTLTNSPQAILIEGPGGTRGEFSGGRIPPSGLEGYASAVLRQLLSGASVRLGAAQHQRVNGLPALFVPASVDTQDGPVALSLAAYQAPGGAAYHFIMISSPRAGRPDALPALFGSFRLLSEEEARSLRPRTIDVRRAGPGDSPRTFAAQMAGEHKLEHFLVLNGRSADQPLRPGDMVKVVVEDAQ